MLRIGLTGGIACGKSTVAERFAALGVPVIDSDRIAREVVAPGQPALKEIARSFGNDVIRADGTLDRAELRQRVFADAAARERLNAIVHPRVRTAIEQQVGMLDTDYCIIVIPLLVEAGMTDLVDRILVVDCTPELQLQRLLERDGMTRALAQSMIASQTDRQTRLEHADDIIDNCASREALDAGVAKLDNTYKELARQANA